MVRDNGSPYRTAFTISIEARAGVSTGISAADRAHTIRVAVDPASSARDIVSPGHVFPLRSRDGGVLVRAGQTEGSVDLSRLAGCAPAGVICEIMNEDGTMSRLPQLLDFARKHRLTILTVADLIAWRLRKEPQVERVAVATLQTESLGLVRASLYRNRVNALQYLALVKGELPKDGRPVAVRVHVSDPWGDLFGAIRSDAGVLLPQALRALSGFDEGVVLYILRPWEPESILRGLRDRAADFSGPTPDAEAPQDPYPTAFRDYGLGAQVLRDLGVRRIRLLTGSDRRLVGVEGFGIEVVERVPVPAQGALSALRLLEGA
jgi:3,4-dihydroxy 2-butanone 4-phosphate synthase/GTP cyclohydrolase II